MKRIIILSIAVVGVVLNCLASPPKEIPELRYVFEQFMIEGSILIYDENENVYLCYDLERCNTPFCPASTFKIPNTLIALESGIATPETVFEWNGEKRAFSGWERDMTLTEAFTTSVVPVYQEIARRVGVEQMQYYTRLFDYGDLDINPDNIDCFWLEGNSAITQFQQIYFLRRLYHLELPARNESMKQVMKMMEYETTDNYVMSGKTGWAIRQKDNITWFVGYVETNDNVYFFATNVASNAQTDMKTFGTMRILLTKEIFKKLGVISSN